MRRHPLRLRGRFVPRLAASLLLLAAPGFGPAWVGEAPAYHRAPDAAPNDAWDKVKSGVRRGVQKGKDGVRKGADKVKKGTDKAEGKTKNGVKRGTERVKKALD